MPPTRTILLSLLSALVPMMALPAQSSEQLVIPRVGLAQSPLVLDDADEEIARTTLEGSPREVDGIWHHELVYDSLGIGFDLSPYRMLRTIRLRPPFRARTAEGIVLGASTLRQAREAYPAGRILEEGERTFLIGSGISFSAPAGTGDRLDRTIEEILIFREEDDALPDRLRRVKLIERRWNRIARTTRMLSMLDDPATMARLDTLAEYTEYFHIGQAPGETFTMVVPMVDREIERGWHQKAFLIEDIEGPVYSIIRHDGNIVATGIYDDEAVQYRVRDSQAVRELLDVHERVTGRRVNLHDPIESPFQVMVVGTACGIAPEPAPPFWSMAHAVRDRDVEMVRRWAGSLAPETRTYGVMGLGLLAELGVPLTDRDMKLVESARDLNAEIWTCQGCDYGEVDRMGSFISPSTIRYELSEWKYFFGKK